MTSRLDLWRDGVAVESAEQPQDQKHYNHQPNRATQAIVAVSIVSVVATTAAQQDDHQKNNQKRAHAYSLDPVGAPTDSPIRPARCSQNGRAKQPSRDSVVRIAVGCPCQHAASTPAAVAGITAVAQI